MEQGTIASWEVKVGDAIKNGTVLAQVQTDKAVVAFESMEEGFVAKILIPAGVEDVKVNSPALIVVQEEADVAAFAKWTPGGAAPAAAAAPVAAGVPSAATPAAAAPTPASAPTVTSGRVFATPLAKKVAAEQGVALAQVKGSGENHRILSADVREHKASAPAAVAVAVAVPTTVAAASQSVPAEAKKPAAAPAGVPGQYVDEPVSTMRKVIAQRLTQSKQTIPHYYLTSKINVDSLMKTRSTFNKMLPENEKLSINDFIIKASALALKAHPDVNSAWMDTYIRRYNYVDVSVAVATPNGLITPIIQDADIKGLKAVAADARGLYAKARAGTLKPEEFQGGTFTISNLGSFGISEFSAIINPPQAVILAVGGVEDVVVATGDEAKPFKSTKVLTVTASCDHRVVDGAVGAQFLKTLKDLIENPMKMLL